MAHENRELVIAGLAGGNPISLLNIGTGEIGEALRIVDRAGRFHLGYVEPADAGPAYGERIVPAVVMECAAAQIAAADEGDLHLRYLDRAGWLLIGRQGRGAKHEWQEAKQPAKVTALPTSKKRAARTSFHKLPHEQRSYGTPDVRRRKPIFAIPAAMFGILNLI